MRLNLTSCCLLISSELELHYLTSSIPSDFPWCSSVQQCSNQYHFAAGLHVVAGLPLFLAPCFGSQSSSSLSTSSFFSNSGALNQQLLDICNKTFNGDRPNIWVKSGIIPLAKKGDLGDTGNYRVISLTITAAKIYNKILLDRIRPHLDPLLRVNQNGFHTGRSKLPQILTRVGSYRE